jgi:hypothetical protein
MKLLDDPKIPTARQNSWRPHHSHKPLDVATEMGLKLGRPYCTRRCHHHHLSAAPTNLDHKNGGQSPQNRGGALLPTRVEIHRASMAQMPQRRGGQHNSGAGGRQEEIQSPDAWVSRA